MYDSKNARFKKALYPFKKHLEERRVMEHHEQSNELQI